MIQSGTNHRRTLLVDEESPPALRESSNPPSTLLRRVCEKTEEFIAAYPAVCVGTALTSGLLLGWWVKRK